MDDIDVFDSPLVGMADTWSLLLRFLFNAIVTWCIIHFLYYRKSRRRDYYFTFMLISVSIFFLISLLGSVKLKIGFALGLFAIFGIIRYRTESMPVREMTYLFVLIALSVINALAVSLGFAELIATNIIFILIICLCDENRWLKHISCKMILYDRTDNIKPEQRKELIEDLRQRTGLDIVKVEVGGIDFIRDTTVIKVFYMDHNGSGNSVDKLLKLPDNEQ